MHIPDSIYSDDYATMRTTRALDLPLSCTSLSAADGLAEIICKGYIGFFLRFLPGTALHPYAGTDLRIG